MQPDYVEVTEISGDEVSREQIERIHHRYTWASQFCKNKDVVEAACGSGQGLGFLNNITKSLKAGDFSEKILAIAKKHYHGRIDLIPFDAQIMPFPSDSKDVIILYEALYYIPDAEKFVSECKRVLKPGGKVLISTANKDLYDFNPSPYSFKYYGVRGLNQLFGGHGFDCRCFGYLEIGTTSLRQQLLRPIKKIVVHFNLMPKSMAGKKLLKRFVFGNLVPMPYEISGDMENYTEPLLLDPNKPDVSHKVIYCEATLRND